MLVRFVRMCLFVDNFGNFFPQLGVFFLQTFSRFCLHSSIAEYLVFQCLVFFLQHFDILHLV